MSSNYSERWWVMIHGSDLQMEMALVSIFCSNSEMIVWEYLMKRLHGHQAHKGNDFLLTPSCEARKQWHESKQVKWKFA